MPSFDACTILLAKVETDILVNLNTFLVNFVYNLVTCVMLGEVKDMTNRADMTLYGQQIITCIHILTV